MKSPDGTEITEVEPFEVDGSLVTVEVSAMDRLHVIVCDEVEFTVQWDGQSRAEIILVEGKAVLYT